MVGYRLIPGSLRRFHFHRAGSSSGTSWASRKIHRWPVWFEAKKDPTPWRVWPSAGLTSEHPSYILPPAATAWPRGGYVPFRRSAGSVERSSPLSRAYYSNARSLSGMAPRSASDCNRCLTHYQAPITQFLLFFQTPCNENTYGAIAACFPNPGFLRQFCMITYYQTPLPHRLLNPISNLILILELMNRSSWWGVVFVQIFYRPSPSCGGLFFHLCLTLPLYRLKFHCNGLAACIGWA